MDELNVMIIGGLLGFSVAMIIINFIQHKTIMIQKKYIQFYEKAIRTYEKMEREKYCNQSINEARKAKE